jgi:hypothetical protein
MTPVEAMARAIAVAKGDYAMFWSIYAPEALAALRALRENVSEGMVEAALEWRLPAEVRDDVRNGITAALRAAEEESK